MSAQPLWTPDPERVQRARLTEFSARVSRTYGVDVTAYAGQRVRFGFYHTTDNDSGTNSGWFVDDLQVVTVSSGGLRKRLLAS